MGAGGCQRGGSGSGACCAKAVLCYAYDVICHMAVTLAFMQAEDRLEKLKEEAELAKSIAEEEEDEF